MIYIPCKREFRFTSNMKIMCQTCAGDSSADLTQLIFTVLIALKRPGKYFLWQSHFPTSWKYRFAHIHNMMIENKI